ncbi:MAG: hypothetical protein R2731_10365 [Nocardioides sp.]
MDLTTFYGFFSAMCFTLIGLWWNVVQGRPEWLRRPDLRRAVGGVYLSFLLPALMGLFAQVGGAALPAVWRVSFVGVAVVGCASTVRLWRLTRAASARRSAYQAVAAGLYLLIAVVGMAPEIASRIGLAPIQAEALLLVALVVLAHGLVWEFMTHPDAASD